MASHVHDSSEDDYEPEEPESEERDHDEVSPVQDQLPQELLAGFDGEPPILDDEDSGSEKENHPINEGLKRGACDSADSRGGTRRSKQLHQD